MTINFKVIATGLTYGFCRLDFNDELKPAIGLLISKTTRVREFLQKNYQYLFFLQKNIFELNVKPLSEFV